MVWEGRAATDGRVLYAITSTKLLEHAYDRLSKVQCKHFRLDVARGVVKDREQAGGRRTASIRQTAGIRHQASGKLPRIQHSTGEG